MKKFLANFKLYRKWVGGTWYYVYWVAHYLHDGYHEWTQDENVLNSPWYAQLIKKEEYRGRQRSI